ncbi:NAD(P)-binding protein [Ophiobolus disseminans]|uniref:NAD(P)-binding protein n=1 Tax=Ophiobolus disseminans TaxID=1469910 RepID=A0A6A6ZKE8_9PLEO|nr:NAD(P)-binding protein [Ophiobolus disseminans]
MAGTIVLTGANGSLALPAVEYLLSEYPSFTVVLTVRDDSEQDRNTTELRRIVAKHTNASVSIRKLDLASLKEAQYFSDVLRADITEGRMPRLAAIICNAMAWKLSGGPGLTDDGFETTMAINHLAHFAIALRLLGVMDPQRGRIVFLGSIGHWPEKAGLSRGFPTKLPEDLDALVHPPPDPKGEELGRGFRRYGMSKLVILMVAYELDRRLKTPRLVPVEQAARPVVDIAVADQFAGQEGYFEGPEKAASSPDSMDEEMQKVLWERSVAWCGLNVDDTIVSL